jgi:hypothetical protein
MELLLIRVPQKYSSSDGLDMTANSELDSKLAALR